MRLIDAEFLIGVIATRIKLGRCELANDIYQMFIDVINVIPTVEAEPVKHGKWLNEPPYTAGGKYLKGQECSICHSYFVSDGNKPYSNHPYCPQCGVKMDGD